MNEFDRWFSDNGDDTHRLNYLLTPESIVIDLGGYEGKFANKIFQKYGCDIYIFEPMKNYYENLICNFHENEKIKIFNLGCGDKNEKIKIYQSADASSIYKETSSYEEVELVKLSDFIITNDIKRVDLLKINIEGSEFEVLKDLIDSGIISVFDNIQVQFHSFVENAVEKRNTIREFLKLTHQETYCYEFVWENWKKINL